MSASHLSISYRTPGLTLFQVARLCDEFGGYCDADTKSIIFPLEVD